MNWPDVIQADLISQRHGAADAADAEVTGLLRRAEAHALDLLVAPDQPLGSFPVVCPVFQLDGQIVQTISTVMRFDTAVEVDAAVADGPMGIHLPPSAAGPLMAAVRSGHASPAMMHILGSMLMGMRVPAATISQVGLLVSAKAANSTTAA